MTGTWRTAVAPLLPRCATYDPRRFAWLQSVSTQQYCGSALRARARSARRGVVLCWLATMFTDTDGDAKHCYVLFTTALCRHGARPCPQPLGHCDAPVPILHADGLCRSRVHKSRRTTCSQACVCAAAVAEVPNAHRPFPQPANEQILVRDGVSEHMCRGADERVRDKPPPPECGGTVVKLPALRCVLCALLVGEGPTIVAHYASCCVGMMHTYHSTALQ